ncbi:malignant fibrous histiocytoma-amplified sequence 1 homolog [Branchiostoma lanceolatum]|uniref:malignant fibrous histiocytoma-amplified sequence 1 homolog n=1 Tax=Branchiostoma lanceolatum TaxID=7740 RepID=UPI00345159FB
MSRSVHLKAQENQIEFMICLAILAAVFVISAAVLIFVIYEIAKGVVHCLAYLFKKFLKKRPDSSHDESSQQDGQGSPVCSICNIQSCTEDHESTFLFDRGQYEKHCNVEHINLAQKEGKGRPLTIFKEIKQFKKLKTVEITGVKLDDSCLSNLFQCTSIHSLKLSNCQLVSVPGSLANLKDLETLDLSHNYLVALPASSIRSMPCLKTLNISHNHIPVIGQVVKKFRSVQNFDMSYNLVEEIPCELLEMEKLKSLSCSHNKITRWLEPSNSTKQTSASSLNFLDLSNNKLKEFPQSVNKLKSLTVLNLSNNEIGANTNHKILRQQLAELFYLPLMSKLQLGNNNIKTLPSLDTTKISPNMELIDLSNNEIYDVPSAFLLFPKLQSLLLGDNNITNLPMDLDLKNLSPSLSVIDLSNNELVNLPLAICFLPSLEKLDMKQNKMRKISENIKRCSTLCFLDVSANRLKEIPSHVLGLPKLVEIRASNNQISSVNSLQKEEPSLVEIMILADNALANFPEVLIRMPNLRDVDLSNNEIKLIPQSIRHMHEDVRLNLQDNPIVDPPLEVCQAGVQAIGAFYEDLTTASSITQCLKTLFLGTYEAGKTSLIRALQLNRSNLTRPEERTHGIEIAEINLEVPNTPDITLSVWDFAGQETYYITHQFFLSSKALMLLIVNLDSYNAASFYSKCGYWLENMIAKVGNPVVIPVVTHIDKLSKKEVDRACKDLNKKLEDQERKRVKDLQRQLERIDETLLESEVVMRERKKRIEALLQNRPSIHPRPVPVSSSESLEGIQYLTQVILNYAVNKEFFPEVGRTVPKVWADTEACVEKKGEELSFPYMSWSDFASYLTTNVPNLQPESRTKTVAQYLHDTGKILWYSEIETLRKHVFLKPASLVDIFRKVIRYDIKKSVDYESNPCFREAEITRADFDTMKNDLVRNGILDTKLLRCLWSDVVKECRSGTFEDIFRVLIELMRQFDLCYDLHQESHSIHEDKKQHPISKLLLPWYIKDDLGDKAERQWGKGVDPIISLQYQFPSFIPPGLFARLTVRAHGPKHHLHFALHWSSGTLCKHKTKSTLVLLKNEGVGRLVVSLSARPESKNVHRDRAIEDLWNTLQELSLEVEELLKQWPGVRFDRFAVCPKCHKPAFPGEWLHRTCRGSEEREICYFCSERVPLKCLVPPALVLDRYTLTGTADLPRTDRQRLSDRQLLQVAKTLGAEWEELAILMDFTQADVYKFKSDNLGNTQGQIFTMLRTWRDREGSKPTRGNLQRIFKEAGLHCDTIA